ncbi:MAG: NAD(+)/NADH kinase [Solirubrobacterales bacterium]|nr:NAD(+)/NADH kinase [Solirubrobacterales bacterium]
MARREEIRHSDSSLSAVPGRIGLVVHPTRAIDEPLGQLREWADVHDAELLQVPASCQQQPVAEAGDADDCDLLVSIGGDGTALAAIRAGAVAARPVLATACGSLGILTSVAASDVAGAIERFSRGDWVPWSLPALEATPDSGPRLFAVNDIVIVRAGAGQIRLLAEVDGNVFARIAVDGCVVSTAVGSGAYALAARGPLLAPDLEALLITPLPAHGGSCPPLVVSAASAVRLHPMPGHNEARLEVDGQATAELAGPLTIKFRAAVATVVNFPDQEPLLSVLRQRQLITDSPRLLAEDARIGRRPGN